jgi:transcriptional regulator with XRE-family HTH domain
MAKVKYSSSLLRDRRMRLGYQPCEVADKLGIAQDTYRQWECRGQVPDSKLSELAAVLEITVNELRAEKVAVMVETMFGIPKTETHGFIAMALRKGN